VNVVEAQAKSDAAADLVGLGGPVAQEPAELVAVPGAECCEGRHELVVDGPPAAVDRVVGGQRRIGSRCQEQVHRREQQGGPPLLGGS